MPVFVGIQAAEAQESPNPIGRTAKEHSWAEGWNVTIPRDKTPHCPFANRFNPANLNVDCFVLIGHCSAMLNQTLAFLSFERLPWLDGINVCLPLARVNIVCARQSREKAR